MKFKKVLQWAGIAFATLFLCAGAAVFYCSYRADERIAHKYAVDPVVFEIPSDSLSLVRGAHWVNALCAYCHGENLAGRLYSDNPGFGKFYSRNLTKGKGGVGSTYTDKDWIRSIRHGITPDGRALVTMPSSDFNNLSAADVGAIIAYLKTVPPVDNELPQSQFKIIAKILLVTGALDGMIAAEVIDHSLPPPQAPSPAMVAQFGEYLVKAIGCRTCHGKELSGMKPPMPGAPFAPNLTPGGPLSTWAPETFRTTLRTGISPEGKKLDGKFMPLSILNQLTDDELNAIFSYLQSLPNGTTPD